MGRAANWIGSGNLTQLQFSRLVPNEGTNTPGGLPGESSVHAVQPVERGEVPRLLGEHAHHTRAFPTAAPTQGLCNTSLVGL
jgi:hypothetical protein